MYQKRLKKERRARKRLQEQLDLEIKRRTQLEEALKATGASSEQVRAITGKYRFRVKMERERRRLGARACSAIIEISRRETEKERRRERNGREFPSLVLSLFLSIYLSISPPPPPSVIQDFRVDSSEAEPPLGGGLAGDLGNNLINTRRGAREQTG